MKRGKGDIVSYETNIPLGPDARLNSGEVRQKALQLFRILVEKSAAVVDALE